MAASARVRVSLAGPIQLEGRAGTLDERALGRQGRVVFAMLASAGDRPVPKEKLAEALWPEGLPASWQSALRGVVTRVRTALSMAGIDGANAIRSAFGCYQLALPDGSAIDLETASDGLEEAEVALAAGEPARARSQAEAAVAVVAQPFLAGEEGPFPDRMRRQLEALHLRALDVLGRADLAVGQVEAAIGAAQTALSLEPFRESAHRLLMSAYAAAGSRGEALRAYERCRMLLSEELGVRPSAETEAAYVALLGAEPSPAPDPAGLAVTPIPPAGGAGRLPPVPDTVFVGRESEMAALADAVATAAATGRRQVVLLSGDMGVGKTRLALEAAWEADRAGATALYGAATAGGVLPYEPFVEAFGRYTATCSVPGLATLLADPAGALVRLLPEAAARLPDLRAPASVDPETDRALLFSAATAFLRRLAAEAPVVMVLDDLHWAPVPPLLLLGHLFRSLAEAPIVIVAAYRPEDETPELSDILAGLFRETGVRHLHLGGLDEKAVAELVPASGDDGAMLARLLVSRTRGNALFVRELLNHIGADGVPADVPESVHQLVAQRLRSLQPSVAKLVGLAAVVGAEFDLAVLERVSAVADRDALLDDLDEACRVRLIEEVAAGRYRFRLSLVRDVVYEDLGVSRRCRLHQRVAEALEQAGLASTFLGPATLARHFVAAGFFGDQAKAVDYTLAAGDDYLRATAYERAAACYADALDILNRGRDDPARRCEALLRLGDAQRRAGKPRHRQTLLDAARLAQQLGDADRLARAALVNGRLWAVLGAVDRERVAVLEAALAANPEPTTTRARLLAILAVELTFSAADRERRQELSAEALALAQPEGGATLAHVLVARCGAIWDPDTLNERRDHIAEAARLVAAGDDPFAQVMVGLRRWDLGIESADAEEAEAGLALAGRVAEELGRPTLRWQVRVRETTREVIRGHLGMAGQLLGEAHELGLRAGQPDAETILVAQLYFLRREQGRLGELADVVGRTATRHPIAGWRAAVAGVYWEAGRFDEARRVLEEYMAGEYDDLPFDQGWLLLSTLLAEVSAGLGHAESAAILSGRLRPYAGQVAIRPPGGTGSVDRHLGQLATILGEFDDADRHFQQASAIYTGLHAPGWLARTQLGSADMLVRRGRRGDRRRAVELLREAGATARRLGLRGLERQVQALSETV